MVVAEGKVQVAAAEEVAVSEEATAMAAAVGGVAVLEEATAMEAALWREAEEAVAVGNKATAAADLCMKTPGFRSRPSRFLSRRR